MERTLALMVGLALAGPAVAGETAESFLQAANETCAGLIAAPEAAIMATLAHPDRGAGAVTADGAVLSYSGRVPGHEIAVTLTRSRIANGTTTTCTATSLVSGQAGLAAALPALITAGAETVLGAPVSAAGGPVADRDGHSELWIWTTDGFPPADMLALTATPRVLILTRTHNVASAAQN